jgi:cytochrome c556
MNRPFLAASTVALTALALPAAAQFQKAEVAIKYRQSAMYLMNTHLGRVFAMANGRVPFDGKAVADNVAVISEVSRLPFAAYGEGTDKGLPNRARPEIWKEPARFKASADKMIVEVAKLDAAAKTGNQDAIKSAVGAVAAACNACHDDFRAEKYSN